MSPNAAKAFAGLLRSLIVIAALFFIPAWSLRFWQAWVYIAIMAPPPPPSSCTSRNTTTR